MAGSRTATALVGLGASLVVSAVAWYYFETFLLFLFVPFVPFLLRGRSAESSSSGGASASPPAEETGSVTTGEVYRECPTCGFGTADPTFDYCPRDGTRLR